MTKKDLEKLKSYFKDIYPNIYEHYKFLFDIRTSNRSFEFLLALESLLILIFITIFNEFILAGELVFLIPLMAFLVSLFFSLYNLIPKHVWFPWFEKEDIKKTFESKKEKDFYEEGLRSIYGVLAHLWKFNQRKNKIFFNNILTLYIALILAFSGILIYYNLCALLLLLLPLAILFWSLVQKGWGKELVPESPAPKVEEFFDKWKKEELIKKTKNGDIKNKT